jgi:hypothetical protein
MRPRPVGQLRWLTGLGPPVVLAARRGAAFRKRIHSADSATPPSTERWSETRTECQWRASIEPRSENPLERIGELDLVHAVERHARAYEERCETSFREYTLTDRVEQAVRLPRQLRRPTAAAGRQTAR